MRDVGLGAFTPTKLRESYPRPGILRGQGRTDMNADASSSRWAGILAGLLIIAAALSACSDSPTPSEDGAMLSPIRTPTEDAGTSATTPPASSNATRSATTPRTSGMSLDEYAALCGELEAESDYEESEEDITYRELSAILGEWIKTRESMNPPEEVTDWHERTSASLRVLKAVIDNYPKPKDDVIEGEDLLAILFSEELMELEQEESRDISDMAPDVREALVSAGCIDDAVGAERSVDSTELTVGEAAVVAQDEPSQTDRFTFQAERGHRYFIEVVRDTLPAFGLTLPAPDGEIWQNFISADERPELSLRWEASVSGAHYFLVTGDEAGAGSYSVAVLVDPSPRGPSNVRYAWDGSSIRVGWDPVDGADYYNVYYDDFFPEGCVLNRDGSTRFCDELATNVTGAIYVHADPDIDANYYWVAACNSEGCSDLGWNPATPPQTAAPGAPSNIRHDIEDSVIRIAWDPVDGADFYNVYHFFFSDCDLGTVGRPGFCERLAANVTGTSYAHANADNQTRHYYWITACNPGGCSPIERNMPDISLENIPGVPAGPTVSAQQPTLTAIAIPTAQPSATPEPVTIQIPTPAPIQPSPTAEPSPTAVPPPDTPTPTPVTTPTAMPMPTQVPAVVQTPAPTSALTATPAATPVLTAVHTPTPAPAPTALPQSTVVPTLAGTAPAQPSNVRYALEGPTTILNWEIVAGAEYYNVYYDDFFDSGCALNRDGSPRLCEKLAEDVRETTYVHADRGGGAYYYWVNACNISGCSDIDSANPAMPIEAIPMAPSNISYAWDGSITVVSWDAVDREDYYNVYHHDFFDDGCRLNRDGSPRFCGELAMNLVETTYVHTDPDDDTNYYWVVACNRGGCSEIDSANPARPPDTGSSGPADIPLAGEGLRFADSAPATRSIPENTPGGVYVGTAVSVVGAVDLAYTMSGTDAANFSIVRSTGQILTREDVIYDHETQSRRLVTVTASNDEGGGESIDVVIHIEDLAPACEPLRNLRTNHGDGYLTVRWSPSPQGEGKARVLGYEVEIRRGEEGPWTDRRAFLGRSVGAMIYDDLENLARYWVRARTITTEGNCGWSAPALGIPTGYLAPIYPTDRLGNKPVGGPERDWMFLTQNRCRYTVSGVSADADCRYENAGPDTSRIFLEFDDPSLGSCEVSLAYSSLTAGSFVDECFEAGVNTETPFDTSFKMPRSGPRTESQIDVPRAPRSEEEFDVLAWGRDDLIPGLLFGCPPIVHDCQFTPGQAWRVERDPVSGLPRYIDGNYTYESAGASRGTLTFRTAPGDNYVFTLDFDPSGHMRVTVADDEGEVPAWPGMPHLDLALGGQPILLPIPPSWSAAIAIESDVAPDSGPGPEGVDGLSEVFGYGAEVWLLETDLIDKLFSGPTNGLSFLYRSNYKKIGRNRGEITLRFDLEWGTGYENLDEFQKEVYGSTWVFDLTFTSDGAASYTLTISKEGHLPTVRQGFVDFNGDSINLDEFPDELMPPSSPPQASGEDLSGVEIAAAITTQQISGADIQTFLISDQGLRQASYSPGDWLEPKDGSNQQMMIVGAGQVASVLDQIHPSSWYQNVAYEPQRASAPTPAASLVLRFDNQAAALGFATLMSHPTWYPYGVSASYSLLDEPTITQLQVVCMQKGHSIPTRGARYFSSPKTAEGPVQMCQRDCALNETDNIQECVWKCEGE